MKNYETLNVQRSKQKFNTEKCVLMWTMFIEQLKNNAQKIIPQMTIK